MYRWRQRVRVMAGFGVVRVRHATYGEGEVIDLTGFGGRTAKVRFPTHGVIPFRLQQAKLDVIG
jgi:hypothetical protein